MRVPFWERTTRNTCLGQGSDQEYVSWTGQRRAGMLAKQDGHGAEHAEICKQAVTWYKTPLERVHGREATRTVPADGPEGLAW